MTDSIQLLLEKVELQKLQIEVSNRFTRNIALFSEKFPAIAEKFIDKKASNIELRLDNEKNLNLYIKEQKKFFYSGSAKKFCDQQAEKFKRSPFINRLRIGESKSYNDRHLHIKYLNELIQDYQSETITPILSTDGVMTNLMMTGIGLAYQIPKLITDLEIYNLFIYESDLDIFYAALHTIDWQPVLEHFAKPNHSITFCLGVEPDRALTQIEKAIDYIGLHNHIYTFIYQHTQSPQEIAFLKAYVNGIYTAAGGLGYYDDEQIGLAHTLSNLKSSPPIFVRSKNTKIQLPPAFIIGNGPSLDEHEQFLKNNHQGAILFSCGTSFGSLSKFGIKPDFHVEMERTISMKDLLDFGTTCEDRKGVTLLCLNPVAPPVLASFNDTCMALKPNDIGESIIKDYFQPQEVIKLPFSNPTVSNSALSFAISMGFMEIYLIGVDLGLRDDGQHHSAKSPHYDLEDHIDDVKEVIYTYREGNLKARGNFGGTVKTHATLHRAKITIERLLYYTRLAFPNFTCINSNNGVYIEGAQPKKINSLRDFVKIDKARTLEKIKNNNFYQPEKNREYTHSLENGILNHFFAMESSVKMNSTIESDKDFYLEAQRIYEVIKKDNDVLTHMLLRGTVNAFLGLMTEYSFYCQNSATFQEQIAKGIKKYNQLIEHIYKNMREEPFRLDDTHNTTLYRMNQKNCQ